MLAVFFTTAARDDFHQLDGSQKLWVKAAIKRCAAADGQIGKPLFSNDHAKLSGCKKLKNRKLGLRIVFRLNKHHNIEVIEIICIGTREDFKVYHVAEKRLQKISADLEKWTEMQK